MPATEYVGTEIDSQTRDAAARVLDRMGMTFADVIHLMISKTARDNRLPFDAEAALDEEYGDEVPNEETLKAFEDIDKRDGLHYAKDADDMFKQLGI